ncbi:MAG TPA: MaoC family dehydratase [Vicinamibacterales bacterium]|nr:MaoC family dehydratase [Vicinamibacterales bacterium]
MITIADLAELREYEGREVGVSDWVVVTQERIHAFADATGDHQWIHVDAERAAVDSPYGTPIAHGFLTLSLISALMRNAISLGGLRMTINYGLNRVRFVSAVPADARIRARITLASLATVDGGAQATWQVTVERDGSDKPAVVAEWVVRYSAA